MLNVNIAFTGVYDIDNFGDHLFPIVFKEALKLRNINCNLILFSPTNREVQGFNQNNKVYSLYDIDKVHERYCFDAVIVGGGEVLHFHAFKHKMLDNEYSTYPIYDVWTIPSIFCKEYGVPLLWNNPGAPFKFEGTYELLAKQLISNVDYISVRNRFTYNSIKLLGIEDINLSVDTAFYLPEIIKKKDLPKMIRKLNLEDNYIVFHCNRLISDEYLNIAINELLLLNEQGYKIVLLPLAYTNGDDDFAKKINSLASNKFIIFEEELSIIEIIAILANTKLYIGVSFHGAITSFVYGRKVIGFDFFSNKKTKDLFELIGLENNYLNDANKLNIVIKNVLNNVNNYDEKYNEIIKILDNHFNHIEKVLVIKEVKSSENNKYSNFSKLLTYLSLDNQRFIEERTNLTNENNYNLLNWQKCSKEMVQIFNELENEKEKNRILQEIVDYYKPAMESRLVNRLIKIKKNK